MITSKSKISQATSEVLTEVEEYIAKRGIKNENNMTPCIFVQQLNQRKYHVGWRWAKIGSKVGKVQIDTHTSYSKGQRLLWVYEG